MLNKYDQNTRHVVNCYTLFFFFAEIFNSYPELYSNVILTELFFKIKKEIRKRKFKRKKILNFRNSISNKIGILKKIRISKKFEFQINKTMKRMRKNLNLKKRN